jgi:hypothetical protein
MAVIAIGLVEKIISSAPCSDRAAFTIGGTSTATGVETTGAILAVRPCAARIMVAANALCLVEMMRTLPLIKISLSELLVRPGCLYVIQHGFGRTHAQT